MSSENRSSSAVRNLRSLFENKSTLDSGSPDSRGRSPSGLSSDKENGFRPTSKVRASFVPVESVANMAARSESTGRRGSFGEGEADLLDLKKTISQQKDKMEVPESVLESAAVTPLRKGDDGRLGYDASPLAGKQDKAPENPDKPVMATEEEPSGMKPAEPASEAAVSGGQALPPVAEDLRSSTKATSSPEDKKSESKKPLTNGKPAAISTKASTKAASNSMKSPASQPKTPVSGKASSSNDSPKVSTNKAPLKKPSRTSLAAPTAASMARTGGASDKVPSSKTSPTAKPKPREVTKPIDLPSHLTAPTAASRAKHDATPAPTNSSLKTSTTSRPKPQTSTKPAPRSSLSASQRRMSQGSHTSERKSLAPVDGSFLERMMRPTASSASKTHEKVEAKSPPKAKSAAQKPRSSMGSSKTGPRISTSQVPVEEIVEEAVEEDPQEAHEAQADVRDEATQEEGTREAEPAPEVDNVPALSFAGSATSPAEAQAAIDSALDEPEPIKVSEVEHAKTNEPTGNETPIPHTNGHTEAALEATPAALGEEETIR